jgi:formate hydrogenlyase subunit 6/NADH:ubiquinone oxidoreductase subunit I
VSEEIMFLYLKNTFHTVMTIFDGLSITFSYLVRRPTTIQYPDQIDRPVQETLPKRYRGHLEVDLAICTNCKACERECPISCIAITDSDEPDKKRWMAQFDIDLAKCMYCGICSEVCPTGAIRHSQEFEGSCYDPAAMARHFVLDGEGAPAPPYKPKKGEETDPELGEKVESGKQFMDLFAQP